MSLETISPSRRIQMPLGFLIAIISFVMSISIGYGGYKVAYENRGDEMKEMKEQIKALSGNVVVLNTTVVRLDQQLRDMAPAQFYVTNHHRKLTNLP